MRQGEKGEHRNWVGGFKKKSRLETERTPTHIGEKDDLDARPIGPLSTITAWASPLGGRGGEEGMPKRGLPFLREENLALGEEIIDAWGAPQGQKTYIGHRPWYPG